MLKKLLLSTAITGLMMSAAAAQSNPTPANPPADKPAATAPAPATQMNKSSTATTPNQSAAETKTPASSSMASTSEPKFIADQGADHMVFSKFNGTDVVGPDNKKIGDVSDILFDKDNKILAYVVGVGGFLGIGEKNVAIEPSAFQVWHDPNDKNANANDPNDMKLKVSWTKDQLKNAPDFKYYKAPSSTASTGGAATTGAGTPRR